MEKREHSKVMGFLNILRAGEVQAIPKTWDDWIPMLHEKTTQAFQS